MERWKWSIRHAQPHKHHGWGPVTCLRPVHWTGYVASLLAVVLASAGAGLARYLLGDVNISLIYLVIVVGVATIWGRGPANTEACLPLRFSRPIVFRPGGSAATARGRGAGARRRACAAAVLYDL